MVSRGANRQHEPRPIQADLLAQTLDLIGVDPHPLSVRQIALILDVSRWQAEQLLTALSDHPARYGLILTRGPRGVRMFCRQTTDRQTDTPPPA